MRTFFLSQIHIYDVILFPVNYQFAVFSVIDLFCERDLNNKMSFLSEIVRFNHTCTNYKTTGPNKR